MYLVSHRNSSSKDGTVLNVVNQEAGVVKHLDDVANIANLQNNTCNGMYWTTATSVPKVLSAIWIWIRDFLLRKMIYFW